MFGCYYSIHSLWVVGSHQFHLVNYWDLWDDFVSFGI